MRPQTVWSRIDGGGAEAAFRLALGEDSPAFQGHFPGFPILPGVLQVDWAIHLGAEVFGPLGTFTGLHDLKFQGLIRPGDALDLVLRWDAERRALAFAYTVANDRKSSGTACFAPPQDLVP